MSILNPDESSFERHWEKQSDNTQNELFAIINRTQTTIQNDTLKQLIADCLSAEQDFWKYVEENRIDLRNRDFITAVEQWSSLIYTLPEQKLLLKIADTFGPCCRAQCGSAFCPSAVLRESLRIQNLSFDDKVSLLHTAIQSRHITRSRRIKILETLLTRLLAESDLDKLQKVYILLQKTKWSDLWNIKLGKSSRWNSDRDEFLATHRKNFYNKIKNIQQSK